MGFLTVNWDKISDSFVRVLDTNNDHVLDEKDIAYYFKKIVKILSTEDTTVSTATTGSFAAAFLYGIRKG